MKTKTHQKLIGIIILVALLAPLNTYAYTRLQNGSVWNMGVLLQQYFSPKYSCKSGQTCRNNNSDTVKTANRSGNPYKKWMCVQRANAKRVCHDKVHTQLKDAKDFIGPGTQLGRAFIPSVTSFRVYNSDNEDVTYSCVYPGEQLKFVISSEHRTCGTRALITHYDIRFAGQVGQSSIRGDQGSDRTHNMTGGFFFTAPLEDGDYVADIATINPIAPWMRFRGDGKSRIDYLLENARSGYYTYETGKHTVTVGGDGCDTGDAFRVSCRPSSIPAKPGEAVTFSVQTTGGTGPYLYEWEDGSGAPTYTDTYTQEGAFSQSVLVTDGSGVSKTARCSVLVTNDSLIDREGGGDARWQFDDDGNLIDSAEISSFGTPDLITNNTCTFEWETTGMSSCRIFDESGSMQEVVPTGTLELTGGTYTLECTSAVTAQILKSQPVRCLENPSIREI